jgi:hypothetical protein
LRVERASAAGIETGIVLENSNRRLNGVDRAPAFTQDLSTRVERVSQSLPSALLVIRIAMDRSHRAGTTVNH